MIPTLILSRNRAMQLDLLLQSIHKNSPHIFDMTVIYTYSDEFYHEGYRKLQHKWKDIKFVHELNAENDFNCWLKGNKDYLSAFFTDDCIFYRENCVNIDNLYHLFSMQNLFTYTFRLGDNIFIQDYTINNLTDRPRLFVEKHNSLLWDFLQVKNDHSFGWNCGLDGYIWRTQDLINLLYNQPLESFNRLEGLMVNRYRETNPRGCIMGCPYESNVFVQQINVVHNQQHHTTGNFNVSLKELNERWLSGEIIDLSSMDFSNVNCTHGEISWRYKNDQ